MAGRPIGVDTRFVRRLVPKEPFVRRIRLLAPLALLPVLGFLPGCGPTALTLVVNSGADTVDAHPGDGTCRTAGGGCTLRAAIQESNLSGAKDTIHFAIGTG